MLQIHRKVHLKGSFLRSAILAVITSLPIACGETASTNSARESGDQTLAFASAEGFGKFTQGGRGGRVIEVTNLNDSGQGSLRQCAQVENGPRQCRFMISGTIDLSSLKDIEIVNSHVTIDGSTAPNGGIALKSGGITVKANQVILRHLRVRPGMAQFTAGTQSNGITIRSNEGVPITDVLVDHCSVSWGTDDMINVVFGSDNVTIQWSIISEGLVDCGPQCGGKAFLMSQGARSVSFHHNLSAHNFIRWPEATGGGDQAGFTGRLDFVNNVHYNGNGTDTSVNPFHGPIFANFIGNYWKEGPDTIPANVQHPSIRTVGALTYSSWSGIFVQDNHGRYYIPGSGGQIAYGLAIPDRQIVWEDNREFAIAATRYDFPLVTTTSAEQAYADVLAGAGAFPRDSVDARIIADVRNGTGHWIQDPADVGGWPNLAP